MNVTPLCDCTPWSDAPIVPDIGILASFDPVAIDQASYDLVNQQFGHRGTALEEAGYGMNPEKTNLKLCILKQKENYN